MNEVVDEVLDAKAADATEEESSKTLNVADTATTSLLVASDSAKDAVLEEAEREATPRQHLCI